MTLLARAAAAALLAAIVAVPAGVAAQEPAHPAMIHAGLCDAPGAVVADLGVIGSDMTLNGTAVPTEMVGAPQSGTLEIAVIDVPIPLATIVAADHSIVVHESAADLSILACGNIGGHLAAGKLPIPLAAGEDGEHGIAVLADAGDGATTRVSVMLGAWDDEMHGGLHADATSADVVLGDFHVDMPPTTIMAGAPFTFRVTNGGQITHELVLEPAGAVDEPFEIDGAASELEDIEAGTTRELVFTFTEPGMYQIACHIPGHYEAGMVHTFEVVAAS